MKRGRRAFRCVQNVAYRTIRKPDGRAGMAVIDKKARPEGRAFKHKDNPKEREYYERATLPDLRQVVQTFIFLRWPSTTQ